MNKVQKADVTVLFTDGTKIPFSAYTADIEQLADINDGLITFRTGLTTSKVVNFHYVKLIQVEHLGEVDATTFK